MAEEDKPQRVAVSEFIAKQVAKQTGGKAGEEELADAIDEIEVETEIVGSPFIKVKLIDPYFRLLTSGFVTIAEERLNEIEVEFPEGSGWHWQLAAVEISNDLTRPNLTLTFEDSIVAELRKQIGDKTVPAGTRTRAEFILALIEECNLRLRKEGKRPIKAVIPSLKVEQEVEQTTAEKKETVTGKNELGQQTLTSKDKKDEHARANKTPSVGKGAGLTVKGQEMTEGQRQVANELLEVAYAQKPTAPTVAVEAMFYAAIGESGLNPATINSLGYGGVFSGNVHLYFPNYTSETKQMAEAFLNGGKGFQDGGAILLSRTVSDPEQIAVEVEKPSIWPKNAYAEEAGSSEFLPEARAIINEGGGALGGHLFQGSGSTVGESDVGQLSRGTSQDPYEDSWDCIERLAQQVRWYAFTSGLSLTTFQRGRFFYYMDYYDQVRQKPAAHLDIVANKITNAHTGKTSEGVITQGMIGTFDNSTWQHQQQHKVKGKVLSASRTRKPATPSELRIPVICEPLEYQAGDVFVVKNSGVFNGRWIVTNTTRSYIEGPTTTLTLAPPQLPYPEPAASSTGPAGSQITGVQAVVEQAEKAYSERLKYQYTEASPARENNGTLFGSEPRTMDCSSFASLAYKEAGMPDPSAQNYSPIGNTTSMIAHMIKTNAPQPGDLVFYGSNETYPTHVVVYIGNGNAIGMESTGIAQGPAWGAGNLGEGAGPPIGGEGVAWRLKGEFGPRETPKH